MSERLQKVLAKAGLGSRRHCEDLIRVGRVTVNGSPAALGDRVDLNQAEVAVDGKLIQLPERLLYIKFHKPIGYLSSSRSQGGHPTIFDLVPTSQRVYPVGRLDLQSEGLMLLTDDGALTQLLTHPRYRHEKEYRVLFKGTPDLEHITNWQKGIQLPDGYLTQPAQFFIEREDEQTSWCRIILGEGRKRQIRDMAAVLGLDILRLIRIRIASLELGDLETGQYQECSADELASLIEATQSA
jgi:23S rRNA pseudouridine2605 synthase